RSARTASSRSRSTPPAAPTARRSWLRRSRRPMRTDNLYALPPDLPVPVDDGATDHLLGAAVPRISLPSTAGRRVDLGDPDRPLTVVYVYPHTGRPDRDPAGGMAEWNAIPGARGCTPQTCSYRDHHR